MPHEEPRSISSQAAENLTFIRSAMERSSTFTPVPGVGGIVMGLVGAIASVVAARQRTPDRWLAAWLAAAVIAVVVELLAMRRKARRAGIALTGPSARRFEMGMAPPLVAGAALTCKLWTLGNFAIMAPVWLLLYGAGVLTGGMFSVPVIRALGVSFMAVGIAAALTPAAWSNAWLAVGFGGLHIVFGGYIARNHGG